MDRLLKLDYKKTQNTIKKWAKDPNRNLAKEDVRMGSKHVKRCWTSYVIRAMSLEIPLHTY